MGLAGRNDRLRRACDLVPALATSGSDLAQQQARFLHVAACLPATAYIGAHARRNGEQDARASVINRDRVQLVQKQVAHRLAAARRRSANSGMEEVLRA